MGAAKEERANSSKRVREVMTSQSLKENSTSKVNSIWTLMTSSVSSTSTLMTSSVNLAVSSTVNSAVNANQNAQKTTMNANQNAQKTTMNSTSTSVETKTSISKVKSQLKDAKVAKAKEERANSSKRVREVMTSQSLKENSTSKVNLT